MTSQEPRPELPDNPHASGIARRPPADPTAASPRPIRQPDPTRAHRSIPVQEVAPEPEPLSVPWWSLALVILVVAGVTCGLWGLVFMNRGDTSIGIGPTPTPIFVIITATPTLGPAGGADQAASAAPASTSPATAQPEAATPEATATAEPGAPISIGSTVIVAGTEGAGVAVRQGPGLTYTYFFVGNDGDLFTVTDGPRESDGYTWWAVVDPNDPNRAGWVVQNYLQIAQP